MATQQSSPLDQAFTLGTTPGIKRDGTAFETTEFTDGVWTRFQRGMPRKIGGYRKAFQTSNGIPYALITQSINGVNYVYTGHNGGIDVFTAGTTASNGTGPFAATLANVFGIQTIATRPTSSSFTLNGADYTPQFYVGAVITFSASGNPTYTVASSTVSGTAPNQITTVTTTVAYTGAPTNVWSITSPFVTDVRRTWQFDVQFDTARNNLQLLAHGGLNLQQVDASISAPIYAGNILPSSSNQWTLTPLADTSGENPTGRLITVDGGIVSLYPFLFAYGSNGLIINNHVNQDPTKRTLNDWNGQYANIENIAAGKILRGYPVRGGTASPSGLFWGTESLVRVSFNPGGGAGLYWQYDLLASRISMMSHNAVVQADGVFLWMGVDRFYVYNGNVNVLPNDKNINYLFDNINYAQRQKVWAVFIPRFNEVWWFYPRGTSTECNDAIIYNTKDKIWYDAGLAVGARRSAGYTTETYYRPYFAGWEPSTAYLAPQATIATPSGQPVFTNSSFYLRGDQTPSFAPGYFVSLRNTAPEKTVQILTSSYSAANGNATFVTLVAPIAPAPLPVGTTVWPTNATGFSVWEHEFGADKIDGTSVSSVYSSFETSDLSWVGGGPFQDQATGPERNTRLVRIEPNFVQKGEMQVTIFGRKYASSDVEVITGPFKFTPATEKIDIRNAEYRQLRLRFESDVIGGSYEMGRLLLRLDYGATRPGG